MNKPILLREDKHERSAAGLTYVYPVISRRAGGVSIGINLNTNNACNWRCIYCQVPNLTRGSSPAIDLGLLGRELRGFLHELLHGEFMQTQVPEHARQIMDVALSGNGEPTSARVFPEVIRLVADALKEVGLLHKVPIRVITNGSLVGRAVVQQGLRELAQAGGEVWFKLDAGTAAGVARINNVEVNMASVVRRLKLCAGLCPTWVQTCVFALDGLGPTQADIDAYVDVLNKAGAENLRGVLLYGIARTSLQPEAARLSPLAAQTMEGIAEQIHKNTQGLTVKVSP